MIDVKIIKRCQKAVDKINKPINIDDTETTRAKLFEAAAYIDRDSYLASSFLAFKFYQSDYAKDVKQMPDNIGKLMINFFEANTEIQVEIPAMEFYKYMDVMAKVAETVVCEIKKDEIVVTPHTFKSTTGAECLLYFAYRYDFGFEFDFAANPQFIKDALTPAYASKQEKVLMKLGASKYRAICFEGIGFESLFMPKRIHDNKK